MSKSIDYGMGQTNIDRANGIRYGVISINALNEWAWDSFEADYGEPTCPECGSILSEYDNEAHNDYREDDSHECCDYACDHCKRIVGSDNAYSDEPRSHNLDDGEYVATVDSYNDVFIMRSPYYTRAQFCSPCALEPVTWRTRARMERKSIASGTTGLRAIKHRIRSIASAMTAR